MPTTEQQLNNAEQKDVSGKKLEQEGERIREQERKREAVCGLNIALEKLAQYLQAHNTNLNDAEKKEINWILKAVKDVKEDSNFNEDTYIHHIIVRKGRDILGERDQGIIVDDLLKWIIKIEQEEEEAQKLADYEKKIAVGANIEFLQNLPITKEKVLSLLAQEPFIKSFFNEKGIDVESLEQGEELNAQVRDALSKLIEQKTEDAQNHKKEAEVLQHSRELIEQNSVSFWEAQYGKKLEDIEWDDANKRKQHPWTELEAYYIAAGNHKIESGTQNQNYEYAKTILENRQEFRFDIKAAEETLEEVPIEEVKEGVQEKAEDVQKEAPESSIDKRFAGEEKLKITAVNVGEKFEESERDIARSQLTRELRKRKGRFKRGFGKVKQAFRKPKETAKEAASFVKEMPTKLKEIKKQGIGLHILEDYHLERYKQRARKHLRESGNFLADINVSQDAVRNINANIEQAEAEIQVTLERFEKGGKYLEKGEDYYKINKEVSDSINKQIGELIKNYALHTDDTSFKNDRNKILETIQQETGIEDMRVIADNIKDIALEMRKAYQEHLDGIREVELDVDLQLGKFKSAITNKANYSRAEKIVSWLQKKRVPVSAGLAGFIASVATGSMVRGVARGAGLAAKIAAPLGAGAAAGLTTAVFRAGKEFRSDIEEHERDLAYGREFKEGAERREQMDKLKHDMRLWDTLLEELVSYQTGISFHGELEAVLRLVAEAEARIDRGLSRKVQLRKFTDKAKVEQARYSLRDAIIKCEERAKEYITKEHGKNAISEKWDRKIDAFKAQWVSQLETGIARKEKERKKAKRKEQLKAAGVGAITGFAGGVIAQQAIKGIAEVTGFDPLHYKGRKTVGEKVLKDVKSIFGTKETIADQLGTGEGKINFATEAYQQIKEANNGEFLKQDVVINNLTGTEKFGTAQVVSEHGVSRIALIEKDTRRVVGFQRAVFSVADSKERYIWSSDSVDGANISIEAINDKGDVACILADGKGSYSVNLSDILKDKAHNISFNLNGNDIVFYDKNGDILLSAQEGDVLDFFFNKDTDNLLLIGNDDDMRTGNLFEVINKDTGVGVKHITEEYLRHKWDLKDFRPQTVSVGEGSVFEEWKNLGYKIEDLKKTMPRADWHDENDKKLLDFIKGYLQNNTKESKARSAIEKLQAFVDNPQEVMFEGKQQLGKISVDANGKMYIDVQEMMQTLSKNADSLFDSTKTALDVIRNQDATFDFKLLEEKFGSRLIAQINTAEDKMHQNLVFRLFPTKEMEKAGTGILLGPPDKNGKFLLDDALKNAFLRQADDVDKAFKEAVVQAGKTETGFANFFTEAFKEEKAKLTFEHLEMGYKDQSGRFHTFATLTGANELQTTIPVKAKVFDWMLVPPAEAVKQEPEFLPPLFVPWKGRKPLEAFIGSRNIPDYFKGYFSSDNINKERWEHDRSPRLKKNPKADLNQQEELDWYFEKQKKDHGEDYVEEIEKIVKDNDILNNLPDKTKIIVCIPVAGAHEMKNIYKTLRLYSKQDSKLLEKTVILMNVNWPDDANKEDVQTTIDQIDRAKADFPNLKIAYFKKEWSRDWISSRGGSIYGTVVKYLNDSALKAIQKAGISHDVYLLTNDADARGMSKRYLRAILNSAEKNPKTDGFLGKIEWGSETYQKYPGFHVSLRMMQLIDLVYRHGVGANKNVASAGANFLCKAKTFAGVGGYDSEIGAGADTDLGKRIKAARFGDKTEIPEADYPIKYNNGAWIDTDPSRALRYYQEGVPIIQMWNKFDEGGYEPRGDLALTGGESIESDYDDIVSRMEFQVTTMIKDWIGFDNKSIYSKALNFAFPTQNGTKLWKVEGKVGNEYVRLTNQGRDWLKRQLVAYRDQDKKNVLYKTRGVRAE